MRYLSLLLLITLTGCVTDPVRNQIAKGYDTGLEKAEGFVCNDATVGSVIRRYGVSSDRAQTWKEFCFGSNALDIVK